MERALPDKAVDLLDEAAARVRMHQVRGTSVAMAQEQEALSLALESAVREHRYERAAELRDQLATVKAKIYRRSAAARTVSEAEIAAVVSERTGIPVSRIAQLESNRLMQLESLLHQTVVGQDQAVSAVARAVRRGRSGMQTQTVRWGAPVCRPDGCGQNRALQGIGRVCLRQPESHDSAGHVGVYGSLYGLRSLVGSSAGHM